jgi:hypothetical protein
MAYTILQRTYDNAKKLGVQIKRAENKDKKLDVFKNGKKISTIGDSKYLDYASYIKNTGITNANVRKKIYIIRHKDDMTKKGSNGYYAKQLLWQ